MHILNHVSHLSLFPQPRSEKQFAEARGGAGTNCIHIANTSYRFLSGSLPTVGAEIGLPMQTKTCGAKGHP